jgi:D-cysteine desulfhydrase
MNDNTDKQPPLFDVLPDLYEKIGWVNLDTLPSPVERLENLDHDKLWIKRDDVVSSVYGGNKVRRLEFVLADLIKKKKDRLVTMGAIGTNHGLASAIFCKKFGIKCTLILFDQEVTSYVLKNLLLFHHYGAELIYSKTMVRMAADYYFLKRLKYPGAYYLYAGGSSPLGTLGAVNAAVEYAGQVKEGICPAPDYVICPTASNGTVAGLILGFQLAGFDTKVIGVRTGMKNYGPIEFNTPKTVMRLLRSSYNLLKKNTRSMPDLKFEEPIFLDDYFGEGYGTPTQKGNEAINIFREKENIKLEPVYTAKACAALLDLIKSPEYKNNNVLYWHTYNSVDHSSTAQKVDYKKLPKSFHCFFNRPINL